MPDSGRDLGPSQPPRPNRAAADWSLGTFDGLRRAQRAEFMPLSFREMLERLEQMAEVAERLRLRGGEVHRDRGGHRSGLVDALTR